MKMKIELKKWEDDWRYCVNELSYSQEQFDYIFKHLDFDKLEKNFPIYFNNDEVEEWFHKAYIERNWLNAIYKASPNGYQYLKDNWGKNIFEMRVCYPDKQELKTIVNRIINIELD